MASRAVRFFNKTGLARFKQLYLDGGVAVGGTPVDGPLVLQPTEPPSGTPTEGECYWDDDIHAMFCYNGAGWQNQSRAVQSIVGTAAATLTSADSGSLILFSNATGYAVTLPAAQAGLWFDVAVRTTVSSGVARLACATGDFFRGALLQGTDTTYLPAARVADGSTHLAWEGNGSSTSGIAGDAFRIVAVDDTIWQVVSMGILSASGSEATFWKTS